MLSASIVQGYYQGVERGKEVGEHVERSVCRCGTRIIQLLAWKRLLAEQPHTWSIPEDLYGYLVVRVQRKIAIISVKSLRSSGQLPVWWCVANLLKFLGMVVKCKLGVGPSVQRRC